MQGADILICPHSDVAKQLNAWFDKATDSQTAHLRGALGSAVAVTLASALARRERGTFLVVMDDADEAGYMHHDLVQLLGEEPVMFLPSGFRRNVRFGQRDAANEILRTAALASLSAEERRRPLIVVTYPEAMSEMMAGHTERAGHTLEIRVGQRVSPEDLEEKIFALGFERVDYVYEPGQFAVRGSIVDVYSFASELPLRIDFFDDEVDSIRTFEVETQLSATRMKEASIVPSLSANGEGEAVSLLSFIPSDTILILKNRDFLCQKVADTYETGFSKQARIENQSLEAERTLVRGDVFARQINTFKTLSIGHRPAEENCFVVKQEVELQPIFHKNMDLLAQSLADYKARGYALHILSSSPKQIERLKNLLGSDGITFVNKALHEGYVDHDRRACFFTDHQIFGRYHRYALKSDRVHSGKVSLTLKELQQINPGDYVVHVDHGVGQFGGLVRIPEKGQMMEKVKITYSGGDTVYVSIHALHKVSKYKGKDSEPPRISKLGTNAWEKMKERTKAKIKDIARDLIRLYSQRQSEQGFQFSPDGYMQHELEASFLYEDTQDQRLATDAVKADMERAKPMDRLVCGDVGFGKTEVAIRAAFKACTDGKQVAVLVPTTVLAFQHFNTFQGRLEGFPVRVEYLSRAKGAKATKQILQDLAEGRIDIIIGTHKLIGKGVNFKDLGLLIIDEEQKFGVSTKEKLRQMRTNVDTLTLTATPIPRTLQFSLLGARDMSVIQTPPPNRHPIQTELHTFDPQLIAEAVSFELSRGGQTYVVSNRINGLLGLKETLSTLVPDARIAVGHGQMPPEQLESIILDFVNHDTDVLISTSIIENGIDIPNANTIVICSAQHFGLSDLHQMRGRVGRSNKKAFCYLLAPPLNVLTPEARRRLEAIESFANLGSGIHIAMQDLDIRGAGNLLGAEQSGFIADLGYETYQKILAEAVKELKRDEFAELYIKERAREDDTDCTVESDIAMSFPDTYVPGSAERMLLYRELDQLKTDEAVQAFRARLTDRFGPVPSEGEELISVVALRRLGRHFGAERIILKDNRLRLYFELNADSDFFQTDAFGQIIAFVMQNGVRCRLEEKNGKRSLRVDNVASVREAVKLLMQINGQPV